MSSKAGNCLYPPIETLRFKTPPCLGNAPTQSKSFLMLLRGAETIR